MNTVTTAPVERPSCTYSTTPRIEVALQVIPLKITDFKIQRLDCNENVALKVNLRSFSLYQNYSYPLTFSKEGEPSWS